MGKLVIVCVLFEIQTRDDLNTFQKFYHLLQALKFPLPILILPFHFSHLLTCLVRWACVWPKYPRTLSGPVLRIQKHITSCADSLCDINVKHHKVNLLSTGKPELLTHCILKIYFDECVAFAVFGSKRKR
jgi:hypothetical protein